jgi:beta-galactosidase
VHVSATHFATSGVYIDTFDEEASQSRVRIRTFLSNDMPSPRRVMLTHDIYGPDGHKVASVSQKVKLPADVENHCVEMNAFVKDRLLWDVDAPNLYRVETKLEGDGLSDMVSNTFGFRYFSFDPDKGFFLNGRHVKLMGTNRHQDYYKKGNALTDEMHVRDLRLLEEMGGNFLRISHYPQDPMVTEFCDRNGIVASVEIPIVNYITMSEAFRQNGVDMAVEMVWQDYNSPSVVMWAYMNEPLLNRPYDKSPEIKNDYFASICNIAASIENAIRSLDPRRYTMMAYHSSVGIYAESGLLEIPMIHGWNVYWGWYSNDIERIVEKLNRNRKVSPDKAFLITEYGADADPRVHSLDPSIYDYSCEYATQFHQKYIEAILSNDFVAGSNVWNLNDFYSEKRNMSQPRVNNKGLTTLTREKKDVYYLYEALLKQEPVIHIGASSWLNRAGVADAEGVCRQKVQVFTNASEVSLKCNGYCLGSQSVISNMATFDVPFVDGENVLVAQAVKDGLDCVDMLKIRFRTIPDSFAQHMGEFTEINVMLGSQRYFDDREADICWIPEKKYHPGSWGYVGGLSLYDRRTDSQYRVFTEVDIKGTEKDPLYQTQREGLEAFRADVPDGCYSVYLHFAELTSSQDRETLLYALGNDVQQEKATERVFDVDINGVKALSGFNIAKECSEETAVVKKFVINVSDGKGLDIRFIARKGQPVLNAVRIYRNY